MRGYPITYDSSLSVADNAKQNGVTEWTIRKYIKDNYVDRRTDRKNAIIQECRRYLEGHPGASKKEIHRNTGYSVSTVRQYWPYITTGEVLRGNQEKATKHQEIQEKSINGIVSYLDGLSLDFLKTYIETREGAERLKEDIERKRRIEEQEEAKRIKDQQYAFLEAFI